MSIKIWLSNSSWKLSYSCESHSVMSDSLWPHGLYRPWNSPGQNTGVGGPPFSRASSQPRDQTQVSLIAGRFFNSWATREGEWILILPFFFLHHVFIFNLQMDAERCLTLNFTNANKFQDCLLNFQLLSKLTLRGKYFTWLCFVVIFKHFFHESIYYSSIVFILLQFLFLIYFLIVG